MTGVESEFTSQMTGTSGSQDPMTTVTAHGSTKPCEARCLGTLNSGVYGRGDGSSYGISAGCLSGKRPKLTTRVPDTAANGRRNHGAGSG